MFSVTIILFLVLEGDSKDFGFVRRSLANTLHTLEDMINDVNSIYFQSSSNF